MAVQHPERAYAYTRVSTEMQVDGYSLTAQLDDIRAYAQKEGIQIVGEYCDEGKSGKMTAGRDDFNRMMEDIKNKKDNVRYVLVFKLSRFARNATDSLVYLRKMKEYGTDLISVKENLNSSTPTGKTFLSMMSIVSEMEVENISVQTMAGRKRKAREGRWNGGFAPYGYTLEKGKLVINEAEAEHVRKIFQLYTEENIQADGVAKRLNAEGVKKVIRQNGKYTAFTAGFVKKVLDNEVYKGLIAYGKRTNVMKDGKTYAVKQKDNASIIVSEGQHEAIVSAETWDTAHEKRLSTGIKREKREPDHEYMLSGLVRCPACGKPMYGVASRKKKPDGTWYAVSYSYKCRTAPNVNGMVCPDPHQYSAKLLDEEVEELIKEIIRQPSTTEYWTQKLSKACNIDELQKRVKDLKARRTTLLKKQTKFEQEQNELDPSDKFYDHKYDRISRGLEEIYEQIDELNMALSQTELSIKTIQKGYQDVEFVMGMLGDIAAVYPWCPPSFKKRICNRIISSIEIFPKRAEYGYLKAVHFNAPVYYSQDHVTIWDMHPDILDENGNFNGYTPEWEVPEEIKKKWDCSEDVIGYPEDYVSEESKRIAEEYERKAEERMKFYSDLMKHTDETVVLLSRETNPLTVEVRMEVETGEVKEHPTYKRIQEYAKPLKRCLKYFGV